MKFLCSLILSLSCLMAVGGSAAHAQKLEKLVIGYPAPVASLGIVDVMRKAGLFKKNGLDVDLVYIQGSPILTTAMVSGQVPMAFLGGAAIVASAVGGADTIGSRGREQDQEVEARLGQRQVVGKPGACGRALAHHAVGRHLSRQR